MADETFRLPSSGLQLRSLLTASGDLELSLELKAIDAPAPHEVVVRVEAAPVNPSDLGLLLGAADVSSAYYGPGGLGELRGSPAPARIVPQAQSQATAAKLWEVSEKLSGTSFD